MADGWWLALHGLEGVGEIADTSAGEDGLRLSLEGREWLLDGVAGESVTLADGNGMTVYADLDGDGEVDHITTLPAGGGLEVWSADPHAAAWGMPGAGTENGMVDEGGTWGLPSEPAPELGEGGSGPARQNSGWWRIEREETGRS